ncbi:MAG TPA: PEP-CTERM sorting domain-containing protein [Pyrinomonadaceae bacterium]|jgi:hypothetical protein|nr:PEP-CTERM sorting domain-containing protein [Pyrinomonadaceae bacterium]
MRIFARLLLSVGAMAIIGLASSAAYADGIVFVGSQIDKLVPPIAVLNFEHHGFKKSESGGVSYDGSDDVIFGDISAGPHQQTVAFSDLGLAQASQLRVLLNINEANGGSKAPITVDTLILTAYDSGGNAVFSASLINGPVTLDQFKHAQGSTSDYVFGLDAEAAARFQAALAQDANLRLGLQAALSNVDGGPERFSLTGQCDPTPEPTTMVLLGTGLAGLAGAVRRRRKAAAIAKLDTDASDA